MQNGTSRPLGKCMKCSTLEMRRSKVKVTECQNRAQEFLSMRCLKNYLTNFNSTWQTYIIKVKEVDFYSAFIVVPHTQGAQVRITQCYLQITPYLPLPRKHSPDGASPD